MQLRKARSMKSSATSAFISSVSPAPTQELFERHGYSGAMKTQIDHGIFDCLRRSRHDIGVLVRSETRDPASLLETARTIGRNLFDGSGQCEAA